MSVISGLLRLAISPVQTVISKLVQQINVVDEEAINPVRAMIEAVTSGMWRGQGANAFVEELSSIMIPGLMFILTGIQTRRDNVESAVTIVERADEQVSGIVGSRLADAFNFYSG
jgi:hypothetical protein